MPGSCSLSGQSYVSRFVGTPPDPPAAFRRFSQPIISVTLPMCSLIDDENSSALSDFE